jgi:hypothetical protein
MTTPCSLILTTEFYKVNSRVELNKITGSGKIHHQGFEHGYQADESDFSWRKRRQQDHWDSFSTARQKQH